MRYFRHLGRLLWANRASPADAELRLANAYQRVFLGSATREDQEIVLVDLADFTGFYRVTSPEFVPRETVFYNEGMRGAYGRIFRYLRFGDDERASLETAARESAAVRNGLVTNQQ
jgi:hypothetical protein